ncbi:MAG: hypothetical protein JRN09_03930 [Nitrososphaerota archaeon]|nr:hypothetical protein [Nitrososphaerota archaeon]
MQKQPDAREDLYFVLTSLAHVVVTVLFGMLLNLPQLPGLPIIAFAVASKSFALFAGENERFFAHLRWAALPLAAFSLVILSLLPPVDWVLGAFILLLYWNYPRLLKAREKSPLDILFHGGRYALLFWLGYGGALTAAAVAGAAVVFLFGVAGELLVGLRSTGDWKTTASVMGRNGAVRLVNILSFSLIVLGSFIFSQVVDFPLRLAGVGVPVPLLIGLAIAVFISQPVSLGKSWSAALSVRRREVLVIIIIVIMLVGIPALTRVNITREAPGPNYVADVSMQLYVTGPHSWDGQWIVFDYQGPGNYYYILLHTNGTLELSRYLNGTAHVGLATVQTGLSPFDSQNYQITVDDGILRVAIDGHTYITGPIQGQGGEVRVSQFIPRPNYWVVGVTRFTVTGLSS